MKKIIFLGVLVCVFCMFGNITGKEDEKEMVNEKVKSSYVYKDISNLYVSVVKKMDQEDTNKINNEVSNNKNEVHVKPIEENNVYVNEENEMLTKTENDIKNTKEEIEDIIIKESVNVIAENQEVIVTEEKDDDNNVNNLSNSETEEIKNDDKDKNNQNQLEGNDEIKEQEELKEKDSNDEVMKIHYLKNGFYEENGNTYYYENDNKVTGLKVIEGVNNYFSPSGKYLGISKVKVIDVSYYQKDINWDLFASDSDCYGVILRLGYYTTIDKKFERNLNELKRLNIPYGIYLFSYATSIEGARKEALFTNNMIDKYDIKPTLGIYYDLESWKTKSSSSDKITKNGYNYIAKGYVESVSNHVNNNYNVGIYSGRWYAMNRLGKIAKSYVNWVAEYNSNLKYDGPYLMWQYTSKGSVPGIDGNVDISYLY